MIKASNGDAKPPQFERLLEDAVFSLKTDATSRPNYYAGQGGRSFEKDVYEIMLEEAKGGPFEGAIELLSGQRFPDIVANHYYGVEVKTSRSPVWKTTGNSVLEGTRAEDIERIYLLFFKLSDPLDFRWRRYEECLYDVAVTHSPRYLIDMNARPEETIFSKMGITYESLRQEENPIKPIVRYYRQLLRGGEDIWWLDTGEDEPPSVAPQVRLWANLSSKEKDILKNQAMALFPEIFGGKSRKYARVATWLVGRHGVVSPSLRDIFTAGGQGSLSVGGRTLNNVPKIFLHLKDNAKSIVAYIPGYDEETLQSYWGEGPRRDRVSQWSELVAGHAAEVLRGVPLDVVRMIRAEIGT